MRGFVDWSPRSCTRCQQRPIAGRGGKRAYLCWWCAYPGQPAPPCKHCGSPDYFTQDCCRTCHPRTVVPMSCRSCFAWGVHASPQFVCAACVTFSWRHPEGECAACHRVVALLDGFCRLCWHQARLNVGQDNHEALRPEAALSGQQLFLAGMLRSVRWAMKGKAVQRAARPPAPSGKLRSQAAAVQEILVEIPHDYTTLRIKALAPPDPEYLAAVLNRANVLAETRGWSDPVRLEVRRALRALICTHEHERVIPASTVALLRARKLPVERTCDVLDDLGLLLDDRTPAFDLYVTRRIARLPEQMRDEVADWIKHLRFGGNRAVPRIQQTVYSYLHRVMPVLEQWTQHRALREIDSTAVKSALTGLTGYQRCMALVALRSLFRFLKQQRRVFRNPTKGFKVQNQRPYLPSPLDQTAIAEAKARATTPATRVIVALAAVHALTQKAIRHVQLDAIDLANRRIVIDSQARPLDDFTYEALAEWLQERRQRWPNTANPYLLVSQQTANEFGPVSSYFIKKPFARARATPGRLRDDRLFDEMQAVGPDPLHLATMFGISTTSAERYTDAFKQTVEDAFIEIN